MTRLTGRNRRLGLSHVRNVAFKREPTEEELEKWIAELGLVPVVRTLEAQGRNKAVSAAKELAGKGKAKTKKSSTDTE